MHNHLVDIMEAYKDGGEIHITPPPVYDFFHV